MSWGGLIIRAIEAKAPAGLIYYCCASRISNVGTRLVDWQYIGSSSHIARTRFICKHRCRAETGHPSSGVGRIATAECQRTGGSSCVLFLAVIPNFSHVHQCGVQVCHFVGLRHIDWSRDVGEPATITGWGGRGLP